MISSSDAHGRTIAIETRQRYEVRIESGLWSRFGAWLTRWGLSRLRLVTDVHVADRWAMPLSEQLREAGWDVELLSLPAGESHKSLETCRNIYGFLSQTRADRHTGLLAVGGGVVGDMAGFAAATYMRGIPLVHVPTSLLAQVDSSIGSKVAVDLPEGKNLVGAFYDPVGILTDPDVLASLPPRELSTGMAEIVKAGMIASRPLFEATTRTPHDLERLVTEAVQIKADIVTRDPFERHERMQLNLGHTLGHALESATRYERFTHGEAVAIGIMASIRLSRRLGLLLDDIEPEVENTLRHWQLPVRIPLDISWPAVRPAFFLDKKRAGTKTRFIVPETIGKVRVLDDIDLDELSAVFAGLQEDVP